MVKIRFLCIGLLILLSLVNTCSAAVELQTPDETKQASPGGTVSYNLVVSLEEPIDSTLDFPITEVFSVDPVREGWGYSFTKESVTLDSSSPTNSSILQITVPSNAVAGTTYSHTIIATGYDSFGQEYGIPLELDVFVVNTDVQVPEFPTLALPMVSILGLVAIIGYRKE